MHSFSKYSARETQGLRKLFVYFFVFILEIYCEAP